LISALGDSVIRDHHIGSTAITGMRAKPIMDLLVEISDITVFDGHRSGMKTGCQDDDFAYPTIH
jgi:GrpB-like predicted nucleotidyltransferase (UPF0157 family)